MSRTLRGAACCIVSAGLCLVASALAVAAPPEQPDRRTFAKVPELPLIYRFNPAAVDEGELSEVERRQIVLDQWQLEEGKAGSGIFSKSDIEDRVVDFVAPALMPAFKAALQELSAELPETLHVMGRTPIDHVRYEDGQLRRRDDDPQDPVLVGPRLVKAERLVKHSPLGAVELIDGYPPLLLAGPMPKFPEAIRKADLRGGLRIALDRTPEIPPIDMAPEAAEEIFVGVQCSALAAEVLALERGATREEAKKEAEDCYRRSVRYTEALVAVYDVRVERIERRNRDWLVYAALEGARLYGPHGDLIARFEGKDFPLAEDVWKAKAAADAEREAAEEKARLEAEAARRAEEEAERLARLEVETRERKKALDSVARTDVVGLTLGMSLDEADGIIREHMKVGWVIDRAETTQKPFQEHIAYYRDDAEEGIGLFKHDAAGPEIFGISRTVRLEKGTRAEDVLGSLKAKYGPPQIEIEARGGNPAYVWTPSIVSGSGEEGMREAWEQSACRGDFGFGLVLGNSKEGLVEGNYGEAWRSGLLPPPGIEVETELAEDWAACEQVLLVSLGNLDDDRLAPWLELILFDLSRYPKALLPGAGKPSARAFNPPKL